MTITGALVLAALLGTLGFVTGMVLYAYLVEGLTPLSFAAFLADRATTMHADHPRTVDFRAHQHQDGWLFHANDPADLDTLLALIRAEQTRSQEDR